MADEFLVPSDEAPTAIATVPPVDPANDAKKLAFLQAYAETGNISAAARAAAVGRRTHYDWLKRDKDYKHAFDAAHEDAADALEQEARRRAMGLGFVYDEAGNITGTAPGAKGSDLLMIFLLKGLRPDKYAQQHVLAGKGKGGAVLLEHIVAGIPTADELDKGVVDGELA